MKNKERIPVASAQGVVKEYWKKLSDKYVEDISVKTDEEIREWYKQHTKLQNHLLKRYGESSWRIHEFFELCRAEEISESKFRELVRFEMVDTFEKRKRDLRNKYKSQLSELKNRKLTKVIDEDKIKELEIKIKTLDEL